MAVSEFKQAKSEATASYYEKTPLSTLHSFLAICISQPQRTRGSGDLIPTTRVSRVKLWTKRYYLMS